jgi:hypothetical protein
MDVRARKRGIAIVTGTISCDFERECFRKVGLRKEELSFAEIQLQCIGHESSRARSRR